MKAEEHQYTEYTQENVKAAFREILDRFTSAEVAPKLAAAQETAGYSMAKVLQHVFPLVVEVQNDVIKKFGFPDGREGAIKFTQYVTSLTQKDQEVACMYLQFRKLYLPHLRQPLESDQTPNGHT